jgi:hypothetical protein
MEPAGSGATRMGSPEGVFEERKHHKPRQVAALCFHFILHNSFFLLAAQRLAVGSSIG